MSSVIFEGWLQVLKRHSLDRFNSNFWKKRYFILMRNKNMPIIFFYSKKPKGFSEHAKGSIDFSKDIFYVSRKTSYKGEVNVCLLTFSKYDLYLVPKERKLADAMIFLIQTLVKLKPGLENQDRHFVVRLDKSQDNQHLGCQNSVCLLHISNWGITLALQMSRSVLAQWPIRCIKSFECTGQGRLVITVGHLASTGPGRFSFRARLGQDGVIYDVLDSLIDELARADSYNPMSEMFHKSEITLRCPLIMNDLVGLSHLTKLHDDSSFDQYHKKLAKDLCDYMSEHLGESVLALSEFAPNNPTRCLNIDVSSQQRFCENNYKFKPSSSFKLSDPECFIGCSADSGIGREPNKDSVFINSDNDDSVSMKRNRIAVDDGSNCAVGAFKSSTSNMTWDGYSKENKPEFDVNDKGNTDESSQQYIHMTVSNGCQSKQLNATMGNCEVDTKTSTVLYMRPQSCVSANDYDIVKNANAPGTYLIPNDSKIKINSNKNKIIAKLKKPTIKSNKSISKPECDNVHYEQCQLDNLIAVGDPSYLAHGNVIQARPKDIHQDEDLGNNIGNYSEVRCGGINIIDDDDDDDGGEEINVTNIGKFIEGKKLLKGISLNENTVTFSKKINNNDATLSLSSSLLEQKNKICGKKKKSKIASFS